MASESLVSVENIYIVMPKAEYVVNFAPPVAFISPLLQALEFAFRAMLSYRTDNDNLREDPLVGLRVGYRMNSFSMAELIERTNRKHVEGMLSREILAKQNSKCSIFVLLFKAIV